MTPKSIIPLRVFWLPLIINIPEIEDEELESNINKHNYSASESFEIDAFKKQKHEA